MPVATVRLHVEDGQYWISDNDPDVEFVLPAPGGASGLVGVSPGLAIVITGTQFGSVLVSVQAGESDPGLDTGRWEEVTEVSLTSGPGGQGLSITSGGQGPYEFGHLTPPGLGAHRVRVHARGRDAGAATDVVYSSPVEEHLALPRSGPGITPISTSNYPDGPRQVAEEGFWAWPLPPGEPFTLTLQWPAVGIPPRLRHCRRHHDRRSRRRAPSRLKRQAVRLEKSRVSGSPPGNTQRADRCVCAHWIIAVEAPSPAAAERA